MNYRMASILAPEAASAAGTKTLDINLADPISRITIQFKGLNNGNTPTAHPAKMVSKIELVDGSDVLMSLSGVECQALNYYDKGRMPMNVVNYVDDTYAIATFDLDFGRYLWDKDYAFDPKKFINPQLKITHNMASGGSAPDAGELSVFGYIFDEKKVDPIGFMMAKEQYGYTLTASATEHIDLATDRPYRKLLVQSMSVTLQPWQQYNQLKLDQDNGRRMVINDEKVSNLLKLMQDFPQFTETIIGISTTEAEDYPCAASYERIATLSQLSEALDSWVAETYGGSINVDATAGGTFMAIVSGHIPHSAFCLPFGMQADPADWFNVEAVGSLRLSIKAGSSASGTCEIVSQQLRLY